MFFGAESITCMKPSFKIVWILSAISLVLAIGFFHLMLNAGPLFTNLDVFLKTIIFGSFFIAVCSIIASIIYGMKIFQCYKLKQKLKLADWFSIILLLPGIFFISTVISSFFISRGKPPM